MVKKIFLMMIILLPIFLFSQTENTDSGNKNLGMTGGVGTITINDQIYTRFRLMPEITLGKIGIGLDFDLLIDAEGNVREEDWDDWEDYINKIYYIRYGHRGDKFYGRIGGFPDYTLSYGLIMKNYSNMLKYPDYRQIGLQLGLQLPVLGLQVEGFTANITNNEIIAARVSATPFEMITLPFVEKIRVGVTAAQDNNEYKGLEDRDNDNYPDYFDDYPTDSHWHNQVDHDMEEYLVMYQEIHGDTTGFYQWFYNDSDVIQAKRNPSFSDLGERKVTIIGADYTVPIIEKKFFSLGHYAEYAQILDHKWGLIFPGFYAKFLIFHANLEMRHYQEDFIPHFFDELYDEQRACVQKVSSDSSIIILKEDLISQTKATKGWFGSLTANIANFISVTVSYEDMYGEDNDHNRTLTGIASLNQKILPQLKTAEIKYYQSGFDKLEHFKTPGALLDGKLGYSLSGNTILVGNYKERYQDLNGDGIIKGKVNGKSETIKTFGLGVEFSF